MTVEQLLYDRMLANATLAAIVGDRIFQDYDKSPNDPNLIADPFIVYGLERESERLDVTKTTTWFQSEYAFACVAASPDVKVDIANAVKAELKGIRGLQVGDLIVKDSTLRDAADQITDETFEAGLHMRMVFQEIWWIRT